MRPRLIHLTMAAGLATVLGGCGTTGNFTEYTVPCAKSDLQTRNTVFEVAKAIEAARHEKMDVWQHTDRIVQIVFSGPPIIELLYYSPSFGEPPSADWSYKASVTRLWHSGENADVLGSRALVETAIKQSSCPVFVMKVHTYEPQSLSN